MKRGLKFYAVGALGIAVQLATLASLTALTVPVALATLLAVELTILHNYAWHERFTWRDRPSRSLAELAFRITKFNLSNGAVSLVGNVAFTSLFVHAFGTPVVIANAISIALCGVLNFFLADRFVFAES